VLQIRRTNAGELYVESGVLADMTSGTAKPVMPRDIESAREGKWQYYGLREDAVIKLLNQTEAKNN
jgi:hypothetical protein